MDGRATTFATTMLSRSDGPDLACYRTCGRPDRAPILFLHPVNTGGAVWSAMARELEGDHGCVALDFRGHGRSEPGRSYLPIDYAHDALAVLDHGGVDGAHVVGGSLGGAIAVELAAIAPGRVLSIALFGASLRIGFAPEDVESLCAAIRDHGVAEFFRRHGGDVLGPAASAAAGPELVRLASGRDVAQVCAIVADAFGSADSRAVARALDPPPPSLVVVGSHDPTCPPAMAAELAEALRCPAPVVMEDIGHLPMLEAPESSAALLRRFLAEVDNRPQPTQEKS